MSSFPTGIDAFPTLTQNSFMDDPANYADVYMNSITSAIVAIETFLQGFTPSGIMGLASGGTGANLSATGGPGQIVRQNTVGGAFSVSALGIGDIPWATPGPIGTTAPNSAVFTTGTFNTVSATGQLISTVATGTAPLAVTSTTLVANLNAATSAACTGNAATASLATLAQGLTGVPAIAVATISATGQITSTLATGTAPFAVTSTTNVPNLNASSLNGATFAAPGAIGGGTPSTGAFTTLVLSGTNSQITVNAPAANSADLLLNCPTGQASRILFNTNSVNTMNITLSGGALIFRDPVNAFNALTYTPASVLSAAWAFAGTLDASSSTVASVVMSGGLAVAKAVNIGSATSSGGITTGALVVAGGVGIGGVLNTGNNIVVQGRVSSSAASTTFASSAVATMYRSGGTITPNTGDMVLQSDFSANNGIYFVNGSTPVIVAQFVGGTLATAVTTIPGTTSATTPTVGAFVVGNGTAATSVAIGGGNINAGTNVNAVSFVSSTGSLSCNAANAAYSAGVGAIWGRGNSGIFAANSLFMQSGGSTTAGGGIYFGVNNGVSTNTVMQLTATGFGIFGVTPAAQSTGYGTPTGGAKQASFAAGSITLANLAAAVAQLIIDIKAFGLLGS